MMGQFPVETHMSRIHILKKKKRLRVLRNHLKTYFLDVQKKVKVSHIPLLRCQDHAPPPSFFSWPKVLHDQINLLEQRKERMMASLTSIQEHKWSNCRPVHVMTEPLVDVLSVSLVHHDKSDQDSLEIVGSIYVDDGTIKCFIYEQGKEEEGESDTSSTATLRLIGPHQFLSMESQNVIYSDLRDKLSGETILCGSAKLLTTVTSEQPHQFEQIKTTTLSGTHSSSLVKYMALTFGVFAGIEVQLQGIDKEEGQLEVYGYIFAEYNLLSSSDKIQINLFKIDKDCGDYERVDKESPNITLARSVVAVPAYSTLKIRLNLVNHADNQPLVQDSLVLKMSVDLEDVENEMSIKGFICSSYSLNQLEELWLNRLLCSVVKGTDHLCFAAVHYSVFKDAFNARLKVCIRFKGEEFSGDYMRVCGTIISYYGEYGSHSDYASLFHNSVLFQRSQENPYEKPSKNVALQLSRSVVAVPNNSFLQIEVDLSCSISTRFCRHFKDMLNIEIGKEREVIQGDLVEIIIGVEWS